MGELNIELLCSEGLGVRDGELFFLNLTVISNFSVKLSCVNICTLCSCISLWLSCRYCNVFSAQLCDL